MYSWISIVIPQARQDNSCPITNNLSLTGYIPTTTTVTKAGDPTIVTVTPRHDKYSRLVHVYVHVRHLQPHAQCLHHHDRDGHHHRADCDADAEGYEG